MKFLAILSTMFMVLTPPAFSLDDYYWSHGSQQPLAVDSSHVCITFTSPFTPSAMDGILATYPRIDSVYHDAKSGVEQWTVVLLSSQNWEAFRDSLREESAIASADPVYLDPAGNRIYVEGNVCVSFATGTSQAEIDAILVQWGLMRSDSIPELGAAYELQRVPGSSRDVVDIANALYLRGETVFAEPSFVTPFEPLGYTLFDYYGDSQWHIQRVVGDYNSASVWDFAGLDAPVIVAVVDQGVEPHEDLPSQRILPGIDYYSVDTLPAPEFNDAHGMGCAAIIAASHTQDSLMGTDPNSGVISLNPHALIRPFRIFQGEQGVSSFKISQALVAAANNSDVLSN